MSTLDRRTPHQVTFVVLLAGVTSFTLLQSLVVPVLSVFQRELHTDQQTATWLMTAYLLSASVCTPILGRIGDKIGKERVLVWVLLALAAGALIAATANNFGVVLLGRVVQGAGGAAIPLAFGIVRDEFPKAKVAGAIGMISAAMAVGAGVSTALAGPIEGALGWRALFWLPMIVVVLAAAATKWVVPESPVRTPGRINWGAALLLSSWLVALLIGVSKGGQWGWGAPQTLGLLIAAAVFFAIWIAFENKSDSPLIDMKMMRKPAVLSLNMVALLFGSIMYASMSFLPEFIQTPTATGYGFGATITRSGIYLLPMTVAAVLAGLVSGPLARTVGSKVSLLIGTVCCAVGAFMFIGANDSLAGIFVLSALLGFGTSLGFAALGSLIVVSVSPEQTGVASGMNANIRMIGGAIGTAALSSIITSTDHTKGFPAQSGYVAAFALLGIIGVIATFLALAVPTKRMADRKAARAAGKSDEILDGQVSDALVLDGSAVDGIVTQRTDTLVEVGAGRTDGSTT